MVRVMRNNEIKPMGRLIQQFCLRCSTDIRDELFEQLLTEFGDDSGCRKKFVQLELFLDVTSINVKLLKEEVIL